MIGGKLTFPDGDDVPSEGLQSLAIEFIALAIALYLLSPEGIVGDARVRLMAMPETSVDKNHRVIAAQDYVRPPRQTAHILAKTVAARKEIAAHEALWLRVAATYARHEGATGCWR